MDESGDVELGLTIFAWRGPADRRAYIAVTLLLYALLCVIGAMLCVGLASLDTPLPPEDVPAFLVGTLMPVSLAWPMVVLGFAGLAAVFVGSVAISVRRLHDAGLSGLLVLGFLVLPRLLPDPPWSQFLPPLPALVWHAIMIALPGGRGRRPEVADVFSDAGK